MNNGPKIFVFDDKDQMTDFLFRKWCEISAAAILGKNSFDIALSGGKTPLDFYHKLAEKRDRFQWDKTHIFLVDERMVSYTDSASNYGMMMAAFLKRTGIPGENLHPVQIEADPEISAGAYEADLKSYFKTSHERAPRFDLIMLGIGEDGHTASLFPGSQSLKDTNRIASGVLRSNTKDRRVTLTLHTINNAKNIIFFVTGINKAAIIKRVLEERDESLPATLVRPANGDLFLITDRGAASELSSEINNQA